MSAFQSLATPAPKVEEAVATKMKDDSERLDVEPAPHSSEALGVNAAPRVEPAVVFDKPKDFAPPLSLEEASSLSVAALRKGAGADFESKAAVIKGKVERNFLRRFLPWIYDQRDFVAYGEVARFVVVKGNCIFIYGQETDPNPLYAIQLESVMAIQEDPNRPEKNSFTISPRVNTNEARSNLVTVLLKDRLTKEQKYQITLDTTSDKALVKRFMNVLRVNAKHYGGGKVIVASVVNEKTKQMK